MDELISREAAIEVIRGILNTSIGFTCELEEMIAMVEAVPSVPAVPLDKLCEWLEDNASLRHGTSVSRHSWKQMIASDLIGEKNEDHA